MADVDYLPACCGILELGHIRDDDSPTQSLMSISKHEGCAHVVFSVTSRECVKHKKGIGLANYIRRHKLGKVVSTEPAANPNHRGTLKAWLWTPNKKTFAAWQASMRKRYPAKYDPNHPDYEDNYGWRRW